MTCAPHSKLLSLKRGGRTKDGRACVCGRFTRRSDFINVSHLTHKRRRAPDRRRILSTPGDG